MFTCEMEEWKTIRKTLKPGLFFRERTFECLHEIICQKAEHLVKCIKHQVNEDGGKLEPMDIRPIIWTYAADVIATTIFGDEVKKFESTKFEFVKSVDEMIDLTSRRIWNPFLRTSLFWITNDGRRFMRLKSFVSKQLEELIQARITLLKRTFPSQGDTETLSFLDYALHNHLRGELNLDVVRHETLGFLFAGHDTVTASLVFTLMLIAKHPQVQERINQEITRLCPSNGWIPFDHLKSMNYLDAVIKESLRLFPPAPMIARRIDEKVSLDHHTINTGTHIIPIHSLHRFKSLYESPDNFNPERFLEQSSHSKLFLAFSAGPKACVGREFAKIVMKVAISSLIQNFQLELIKGVSDSEITLVLVNKPSEEVLITFRSRQNH